MSVVADYVAHGLALVAIPAGKKGPASFGWNTQENAITDPNIANSLTGNVGLAHAYCSPTPTMALDIDDMVLTEPWLAARRIAVTSLLNADDAVKIVSGKPGRAKLLYRLPTGLGPIESLAIKEMITVEGGEKQVTVLEFRCGTREGLTVQDILPPSIHPDTGQPYRWGGKGDWRMIPEIPDALLKVWQQELFTQAKKRTRGKGRLTLFKGVEDTPRQRAKLVDLLRYVSADCSYELYRDMVWAIQSLGWRDVEHIAEQWCQTAPHRFNDIDFWNVVNSHDSSRTPTIGTIHHHAKAGGWNG